MSTSHHCSFITVPHSVSITLFYDNLFKIKILYLTDNSDEYFYTVVRFVLLVVLLIFSRKYFVVFWGFHVLIFVIAVIICKSLGQDKIYVNNKLEQDDIDKLKGLGIKDAKLVNVPLVTLFSEDSNFYLEYHCLFYFVVINFDLVFNCLIFN